MKSVNFTVLLLSGIFLLGLTGCARYKAKPLNRLNVALKSKDQPISFAYKVFSASDCQKYLDRDPIAQGYQPLQITLTNNTQHYFDFSLNNLSLNCVSPQEVAGAVHTDTTARVVGYGVTGIFIWPFLIPAVVDGIGSSEANKQLDTDFSQKALCSQTIEPYTTINGIVFVPVDDFNENFTLLVTDRTHHRRFVLNSTASAVRV